MRSVLFALPFVIPTMSWADDLAEGWEALGSINASLGDESVTLQVLMEPDGKPYAFQMDAGGPKIVSIEGHVISDAGTPTWPSLSIDILAMGPVTIVQGVVLYRSGGNDPEMWMMQEGVGEAAISNATLSEDGVFSATLQATLAPWSLSQNAEISGQPAVTIEAEIESRVPEK